MRSKSRFDSKYKRGLYNLNLRQNKREVKGNVANHLYVSLRNEMFSAVPTPDELGSFRRREGDTRWAETFVEHTSEHEIHDAAGCNCFRFHCRNEAGSVLGCDTEKKHGCDEPFKAVDVVESFVQFHGKVSRCWRKLRVSIPLHGRVSETPHN
jgi:hypothetical protein